MSYIHKLNLEDESQGGAYVVLSPLSKQVLLSRVRKHKIFLTYIENKSDSFLLFRK